jgi:3-methyladenine DNA glycosylase AlkC
MTAGSELRDIYTPEVVRWAGELVAAVYPAFALEVFCAEVAADLPSLSLMQRAGRIAQGLRDHLAPAYPAALELILAALPADDGGGMEGMGGFRYLPFVNFVGRFGLEHPAESLAALPRLTCYFSAEFDIRPFLVRYPERVWPLLHDWSQDADWRVRRLSSEGARPRLPWGLRLKELVRDPGPLRPILDRLENDPVESVYRSAANNLNDIAKDHSDFAVRIAGGWQNRWAVRHALRTLIKQGHGGALELLGFGGGAVALENLTLAPKVVPFGSALNFSFELTGSEAADLSVDYAIHHLKANGSHAPKIFKLAVRRLEGGGRLRLEKRHALRPITTRAYYPGLHKLEILVNGRSLGMAEFTLSMDEPGDEPGKEPPQ